MRWLFPGHLLNTSGVESHSPLAGPYQKLASYLLSVLGVALMTVLIAVVPGADHTTNVSLLYLLVVMGAALWLGRGPAVLASLLAVFAFDWFFVQPYHTLTVSDPAEWLALGVFLLTAIVISQLTTLVRQRAAHEVQAQALAEADRMKTALLSMVSHDFRSPLAAIKASVTGLLQGDEPWDEETQRDLLNGINEETDRLNRMVGNILALSRLESGAWRPLRDMIAVSELVGAALDTLNNQENERVRVRVETQVSEVSLDSVQIIQVLHNLLENALKYSPPDSVVELSVTQHEATLKIEVADRGFGLPAGEEERIFERFYRAARWQESSLPGSGIGLAICRGLIEAHGGTLFAANRPGGARCFLLLCRFRPILILMNVLVIDDEPQIRRALRIGLERNSYSVTVCANGEEGLDSAALQPPDMVILDLAMPGMEGLEVCRQLRQWSKAPIIVLSVREHESDKVAALDAGADDYLTKPFSLDELLARMRAVLRRARNEDENGEASFSANGLTIDFARRRVTLEGKEVHLTPTEYDLLKFMAQHPDRVLTHRHLLTKIWGAEYADDTHTLRVHIANLRNKIETEHTRPRFLHTEPRIGYRFCVNESQTHESRPG